MAEMHTLSAAAAQFTVACNLASLYAMATIGEGLSGWFYPWSLLVYGPLVYGANRLFLHRERPVLALLLLNLGAAVSLLVLGYLVEGPQEISRLAFLVIFAVWLTAKGQNMARKAPGVSGMLLCLDGSILVLVIFTAYTAATGLKLTWSIPPICGFAAAILGVTARRTNRTFGWKEWTFMGAAFCVIFAVMWLLIGVVAAPAGRGLVMVWEGILWVLSCVWWLFLKFAAFLDSFFPKSASEAVLPQDNFLLSPGVIPEEEAGDPVLGMLLLIVFVVLVVAVVIWLLRQLVGLKVGGKKTKIVSSPRRTRPSFRAALCTLLADWRRKIRLRRFLRKQRDTAEGLYFTLIRKCSVGPWHKRTGETPREFLTRLRRCAQDDAELAQAIERLIPAVDSVLYAGGPAGQKLEFAALIRRRIGAAVKRQALRDGVGQLKNSIPIRQKEQPAKT